MNVAILRAARASILGSLLIVVATSASSATPPPPPQPTVARRSSSAQPVVLVDVDTLVFDEPTIAEAFRRFDAVARKFVGPEYRYQPYRLGGNSVTATWTQGPRLAGDGSFPGRKAPTEDHRTISVRTSLKPGPPRPGQAADPKHLPRANEAAVSAAFIGVDPEAWCVVWGYQTHRLESGVNGSTWSLHFSRWHPDDVNKNSLGFRPRLDAREKLELPVRAYQVGEKWLSRQPSSGHERFLRAVRTPESLRDSYLMELAELENVVLTEVREHRVTKWDPKIRYEDVRSGKIDPPPPVPLDGTGAPLDGRVAPSVPAFHIPLTAEEEAAELAKATAYFAGQRVLIEKHHQAMYAALLRTFPLAEAFPELQAK